MVVSMEPMIMIPEGQKGAGGYREHDILVDHRKGQPEHYRLPLWPRTPDRESGRQAETREAETLTRRFPRAGLHHMMPGKTAAGPSGETLGE